MPGTSKKIFLQVGKIYDSTDLNMPVHVIRGFKDGPTVFLCAAVHGDEINGIEIVREVMNCISNIQINGTIIAVPVVNVFGFNNQSRYLPDRRDLNRSFPGSRKGSLASQMAHLFTKEIVSKCSHGIDFHTGAIHRSNIPQLRVDTKNKKALDFACAFGAPMIVDSNIRDGSLRETAKKKGVVALVYEAGQALRFEEKAIKIGKIGCLNALHSIGVLPEKPKGLVSKSKSILIRNSYWVRSPMGGTLRLKIKLGQLLAAGDKIGEVSGPFGRVLATIRAIDAGYVIGINHLPLVTVGTAIVHIGSCDELKKTKRTKDRIDSEYVS